MSHLDNVPPEKLEAFVKTLRTARDLTVRLDQGTMLRLRAAMDRVERGQPGLAYPPGEPDDESLQVILLATLDRGLTESERDDGVVYTFLTGQLEPLQRRDALLLRVRRAWHALRWGW